jgi:hypothetical membrane protein
VDGISDMVECSLYVVVVRWWSVDGISDMVECGRGLLFVVYMSVVGYYFILSTMHGHTNIKFEWIIVAFIGFSSIFLLGIVIFKGLTARRLYKSFGVKGLIR